MLHQALSACSEEGLARIVGWWKMGPLISYLSSLRWEMVWKRAEIMGSEDCFNWGRADKAGDGCYRLQLNFLKFAGGGS